MKVIVQPGAGVKKWWEAKHLAASRFFNMQKQKYMESYWMLIQSSGIMLTTGQGGSMTTGNVARKLLHDPPDHEMVMSTQHPWGEWVGQEFGTMSSLILRFVSSSWEVDLDDYRALCTWLYFSYHQAIMAQWFRVGKNTKSDFVFWPLLYHIWKLHAKCDSEQLFFVDISI